MQLYHPAGSSPPAENVINTIYFLCRWIEDESPLAGAVALLHASQHISPQPGTFQQTRDVWEDVTLHHLISGTPTQAKQHTSIRSDMLGPDQAGLCLAFSSAIEAHSFLACYLFSC